MTSPPVSRRPREYGAVAGKVLPAAAQKAPSAGLVLLDHPAGEPGTGITGRLGLEVVGRGMDDEAAADDRVRPGQRQEREDGVETGHARLIGRNVPQVAAVVLPRGRGAVRLATGIE